MRAAKARTGKNPHQQRNAEDTGERDGVGQVHNMRRSGGQPATSFDYPPQLSGTQWREGLSFAAACSPVRDEFGPAETDAAPDEMRPGLRADGYFEVGAILPDFSDFGCLAIIMSLILS